VVPRPADRAGDEHEREEHAGADRPIVQELLPSSRGLIEVRRPNRKPAQNHAAGAEDRPERPEDPPRPAPVRSFGTHGAQGFSGRRSGKSMTSRIEGWAVSVIESQS